MMYIPIKTIMMVIIVPTTALIIAHNRPRVAVPEYISSPILFFGDFDICFYAENILINSKILKITYMKIPCLRYDLCPMSLF